MKRERSTAVERPAPVRTLLHADLTRPKKPGIQNVNVLPTIHDVDVDSRSSGGPVTQATHGAVDQ